MAKTLKQKRRSKWKRGSFKDMKIKNWKRSGMRYATRDSPPAPVARKKSEGW